MTKTSLMLGTALSLGLALAKLHYTLGWWRDLDEAAREAHKSAWWTGGNIGLIVAGAALSACVLSGFDPMPARFAGIPAAYATAGVLGVIAAQAIASVQATLAAYKAATEAAAAVAGIPGIGPALALPTGIATFAALEGAFVAKIAATGGAAAE